MAHVYDLLAWLYSGGQIGALKRQQTRLLESGARVLYAGAGTGGELGSALARGCRPHALDSSKAMLAQARRGLGAQAEHVVFCCEDVFAHRPDQPYDTVVANFFLNVFSEARLPRVLVRLNELLRPGGELLVGDFAPPVAGRLERALQSLYYLPPLYLFRLLTRNPYHPLYDYRPIAETCGFRFRGQQTRRIFGLGPAWLSTLRFEKVAVESEH